MNEKVPPARQFARRAGIAALTGRCPCRGNVFGVFTGYHHAPGTQNQNQTVSKEQPRDNCLPTHGYKCCIHGSGGPPGSSYSSTKYSHRLRRAYIACAKTSAGNKNKPFRKSSHGMVTIQPIDTQNASMGQTGLQGRLTALRSTVTDLGGLTAHARKQKTGNKTIVLRMSSMGQSPTVPEMQALHP